MSATCASGTRAPGNSSPISIRVAPAAPADPEGEVARVAAHHGDEEPLLRGRGVLHQVPHQVLAEVDRGREAEGRDVVRQRQVIVDGLGNVGHGQLARECLRDLRAGEGGVVPADGHQVGDLQPAQALDDLAE